ncbi:hypothetical protein, partial [Pseudomonas aeruginosa]|uniref:hypothetical protein n=1 Tax=Pseudomonas aeruginosa TaxID=287 RepID=UPI0024B86616
GPWLHLPGHEVRLSDSEEQLRARLWPLLEAGRYDPPWVRDLAGEGRTGDHDAAAGDAEGPVHRQAEV